MEETVNSKEPTLTLEALHEQLNAQNKLIASLASAVESLKLEKEKVGFEHTQQLREALKVAMNSIPEVNACCEPKVVQSSVTQVPVQEHKQQTQVVTEKRTSAVDEAFAEFDRLRSKA